MVCYSVCGLITEIFSACEILQKLNQIMYKEEAYFGAICSLISRVFFFITMPAVELLGWQCGLIGQQCCSTTLVQIQKPK